MLKLKSLSAAFAASVLLVGAAIAQRAPLPGLPLVPPPVPHPALAGQPLMNGNGEKAKRTKAVTVKPQRTPKVDPATKGVKLGGSQLKKAVKRIKEMGWRKSYRECLLNAKSTGKPVLWLQTLGDLTGYA